MARNDPPSVPGEYLVMLTDRDFDAIRSCCGVTWVSRISPLCAIKADWKQLRLLKRLPNVEIIQRNYLNSWMSA